MKVIATLFAFLGAFTLCAVVVCISAWLVERGLHRKFDPLSRVTEDAFERVAEFWQPKQAPTPRSIAEIVTEAKAAIVTIVISDPNHEPIATGTGFFIDSFGTVITN